jgi:putative ABC transport system substrate-binding protein
VFSIGSDPVETGLVGSYSRPERNVTGLTQLQVALVAKRVELLHEFAPAARVIALIVNPRNPNLDAVVKEASEAASTLGLELKIFNASTDSELSSAFASMVRQRVSGVVTAGDAFLVSEGDRVLAMAAQYSIPAIYNQRALPFRGGLMSYGAETFDAYKLWGLYTARILKGEKPADLPVLQPTKVTLVINLKTAKALGLTVPLSLLGRADEVIE